LAGIIEDCGTNMNERIRELSKKAVDYANACEAEAWDGAYERKFAELIVKECVELVLDSSVEYATRPQIAEELKQHFGVEE